MPLNVYLAAPWVHRDMAIKAGKLLTAAGFHVTSRWFTHEGDPADSAGILAPHARIQLQAKEDIEDVLAADVLVVWNIEKSEGKAVETGIAIANGIPVISVGPRSNIFQALGTEVGSFEEAIDVLQQQ